VGVRLAHLAWVLLAATLGLPMSASGQTAEEKERMLRNISEGKFQELTATIEPTQKPHLGDTLRFEGLFQWKRRLSREYGLDFVYLNAPVIQWGSESGDVYVDNEMDLLGQWRLFESDRDQGKIVFWGVWLQTFSSLTTNEFAGRQNLLTSPNGGEVDRDRGIAAINSLWWEHSLADNCFVYRLGQLWLPSLWGSNKYTSDDRLSFMAAVLSGPQGVNWASTNRSLGGMATFQSASFYVSAGFANAVPSNYPDFDRLGDGKFIVLGELGWRPTFQGRHEGAYKITVSHTDGTDEPGDERSGWGLMLSLRQDIDDRIGLFARYHRSWSRFDLGSRQTASAGVVFTKPFAWTDDWLGIAWLMNDPADRSLRTEHGVEIFWRLQLTPRLQFTPDLQVYFTPARSNGNDWTVVPGVRLRYVL